MTRRITRTELTYQRETDKYPTEIAWTDAGTWIIPDMHLGRWTGRIASPGETVEHQRRSGGRITLDELHADTVAAAKKHGWRSPSPRTGILEQTVEATKGRLLPVDSLELATYAQQALDWLNENKAPAGRIFVLEDALYLIRKSDQGREIPPAS